MVNLNKRNWSNLHAGHITQEEINRYTPDEEWQEIRQELKGKTLQEKYDKLNRYLNRKGNSRAAQVRVTNYINALARGGQISPPRQ